MDIATLGPHKLYLTTVLDPLPVVPNILRFKKESAIVAAELPGHPIKSSGR